MAEQEKRNRWINDNPLKGANLVDISDIEPNVDHELEIWRAANNKTAARKGFSEWQVDNLRRGIRQRNPDFNDRDVEHGVTGCLKLVEYGQ